MAPRAQLDPSVPAEELAAQAVARHRARDPLYTSPYIDVDEWRDVPEPHRYVHGGFTGTDLRFSFYFPPSDGYRGRFLQVLPPISGFDQGAGTDLAYGSPGSVGFAFDTGAYLVESNMGCPSPMPGPDGSIPGFRGSAAAAHFSRSVAQALYGGDRPYGYVFGGSGGAFKTIACVENAPDVWDGAVPFVQGSPIAIPNCFAAEAHAMRVLADVVPQIVDAIEPGGSGDMYAGLSAEQRDALAEVTRFGFPPGAWFDVARVRAGYTMMWAAFAAPIAQADPTYFADFWSQPGYLGHDAPASLAAARLHDTVRVAGLVTAAHAGELGLPVPMAFAHDPDVAALPVALRVESAPNGDPFGAKLTIRTGAAAGREYYVSAVSGDVVAVQIFGGDGLVGVQPGDEVFLDNSDYLAFQTLPRHQVQEGFDCFDQYVAAGRPVYPQRPRPVGQKITKGTWGHAQSGRFGVKMIAVASMLDEAAYPWQAAWYRRQVQRVLGDRIGEQYRLWFVEHAMHGPAQPARVQSAADRPAASTRVISYVGVLEQALRDVIAWVEQGVTPPSDTAHEVVDAQVRLLGDGRTCGGIQPTVNLTVAGGECARVPAGQEVRFVADVIVPPGTGTVVAAEWDYEGDGDFPVNDTTIDGTLTCLTVVGSHVFTAPGTYFPSLRITAHRCSDAASPYARVQNLGRARVVVE